MLPLFAQKDRAGVDMELQPYTISGRESPLKRNLHFAGYKTHKFHHNTASWFSFGTLYIDNKILTLEGAPLHKTRSAGIFSFALKTDSGIVSRTEGRAVMQKNVDYLEARIRTENDTTHVWYITAANLNVHNNAEQGGMIRCGDKEICFVKTTCMLRDEPVNRDDIKSLFTSLNLVYLFTYNDENIAAVNFTRQGKKFWCRDDLNSNIKTVVASAASLLCLRNDLYY